MFVGWFKKKKKSGKFRKILFLMSEWPRQWVYDDNGQKCVFISLLKAA